MNIYEENLELLKNKNYNLAEKVNKIKSCNTEILFAKSNTYTATYNGIMVNSKYNPIEEAVVRVDSVDNIEKTNLLLCFGFGMGYEINEMLRRVNSRCVILNVIVNLDLFKKVLETMDLSNILSYDNIIFLDGTSENFKLEFSSASTSLIYFGGSVAVYMHPVEEKLYKEIMTLTKKVVIDTFIYNSFGIGNDPGDTLEGVEHMFQNFEHILKTSDLSELKGKFNGIPAICVASGPSLNKNIKYLKEAEGKAVIFAADTILEKLRQENIKFNATSVLERPKFMYDKLFQGKELESNVVLFGDCVIYPKIFDEHNGKNVVLFKSTSTVEQFLPDKMDNINEIPTGYSVAHMNFSIAQYLGFSPIILVGQDLAYGPDGHTHARGTIHESNTVEDDVNSGKVEEELYVKGLNGETLRTNRVWKLFLDWFELEIKHKKIFCIDASEGGAYIDGTEVMTLKDTIEKYCTNKLSFEFETYLNEVTLDEKKKRQEIIEKELDYQIELLEKENKLILDTKRRLKAFYTNVIDNAEKVTDINKYVDPINKNINEMVTYSLYAFIIQALTVELGRKNNAMIELDTLEDCKKWYENHMNYIEQAHGIMKLTLKLFRKALKNIQGL